MWPTLAQCHMELPPLCQGSADSAIRNSDDVLQLIAEVALFWRLFVLRSKNMQETVRILAAWTRVLLEIGPQSKPPSVRELGEDHTSACSAEEVAILTFLDDAGVSEHAARVIERRFLQMANMRREFAECSDDERRKHLLILRAKGVLVQDLHHK